MNCPYNIKICTKCGKLLIACSLNFVKSKSGKYGFKSWCKECNKKWKKQHYEENKEQILEHNKQYYEENKKQILERNKQYREEHKEAIKEQKKQYYEENKEYFKQYKEEHREEIKEYNKQYKEEHREYYEEYMKIYREEHKEEIKEQRKQYIEENPHIFLNDSNKYRLQKLQKENQGNGITKEQWYEMMEFFDWKCAYSGISLTKDNRSVDHIIPLNKNGEHEIWNCVPMHKNYNSGKRNNNMEEWYKKQEYYSKERLQKIYEWCEYAFNKYNSLKR